MTDQFWHLLALIKSIDYSIWVIAIVMSVLSGYVLLCYVDDLVLAIVATPAMLVSTLIAHIALQQLGIILIHNHDANFAAAAGAAICSVMLMTIVIMRLWYAISDRNNQLRGDA